MISSFFMSREQIANPKFNDPLDKNQDLDKPKKVNLNILLNNIRTDKKREQLESIVFIGLISVAVITTGIIASL
jgi:hypothetical protein